MLVEKQSELMSDLLFTVHQHGGDDVTWKPPIYERSRLNFQRVCLNGKQPVSYYFSLPGEWQSSIFPNRSADWSIVPLFSSVMSPLLLRSVLQDFFWVAWDGNSSKRITSGVFGGGKTGTLNTASLGSSCWEKASAKTKKSWHTCNKEVASVSERKKSLKVSRMAPSIFN